MGNLLNNGFHLGEVVDFLGRSNLVEREFVLKMQAGLLAGHSLSGILEDLNFSKNVVTQVALVDFHGNLAETLRLIELNLRKNLKVRRKLVAVATYPLILLLFLVGIMLGLKNYLLPQLEGETNGAILLVNQFPLIFLSLIGFLLFLIGLSNWFFRRQSAISGARFLTKIPLVSNFVKLYLTAYFAREWGNLIAQGVDLRQICQLMENQQSRIFAEVGSKMSGELTAGVNFSETVQKRQIFTPELALMIEYGELKDKLGVELAIYADECWEQFFSKVDRAMQLIQPVIFIFVALMIVLLYAAMLLPIYSNMGKVI